MEGEEPTNSATDVSNASTMSSDTVINMTVVTIRNPGPNFNFEPFLNRTSADRSGQSNVTPVAGSSMGTGSTDTMLSHLSVDMTGTSTAVRNPQSVTTNVQQVPTVRNDVPGNVLPAQTININPAQGNSRQSGMLPWEVPQLFSSPMRNAFSSPSTSMFSPTLSSTGYGGPTSSGYGVPTAVPSGVGGGMDSLVMRRGRGRPRKDSGYGSMTGVTCAMCSQKNATMMTQCEPNRHFFCRLCIATRVHRMEFCPSCGQKLNELQPLP